MWTRLIVLPPPSFDNLLGFTQRHEPMGIQAFLPKGAVERFHVCIAGGLAGPQSPSLSGRFWGMRRRRRLLDSSVLRIRTSLPSRDDLDLYFTLPTHFFHVGASASILMNTPPTTDLAWKPTCVASVVQYQSASGTRVGESFAKS